MISGLRDLAVNAKTESSRVRAYELLGKTLRMFVDQVDIQHTFDTSQLQEFTLEELRTLRDAQMPAIEGQVRVLEI